MPDAPWRNAGSSPRLTVLRVATGRVEGLAGQSQAVAASSPGARRAGLGAHPPRPSRQRFPATVPPDRPRPQSTAKRLGLQGRKWISNMQRAAYLMLHQICSVLHI